MKELHVASAIIYRKIGNKKQILATQRAHGKFANSWEFPGGKVEEGEHAIEAVSREVKEELNAEIEITGLFDTVCYEYEDFVLIMDCFLAKLNTNIELLEHKDARWLYREELF